MEIKILQVFYGKDGLPYKDKDRQVHFPIAGTGFLGASKTTKIKFYYDELDNLDETTWVAVSKLPNGKVGSRVLESYLDEELNEHYALLELDNYYTQYKGDVFISLQGYQGSIDFDYDEENSQYEIHGTPTIAATGSIKFTINYANQFVGSGETDNINFQRILAALGTKLGVRAYSEHVEELPSEGSPDIFYVVNDDPTNPNLANIYVWNENTRHYIWVGDNTLDLGEYYTKEQGEQFENDVNNRVSSVENELSSVAQGSPKGVYATLSDLETAFPTGTTGIYVVSADGHWYYWNGSAWTDGGIYISYDATDDVEKIKSALNAEKLHFLPTEMMNEIGEYEDVDFTIQLDYRWGADGVLTQTNGYAAVSFPVVWGEKLHIAGATVGYDIAFAIHFMNGNTIVQSLYGSSYTPYIVVPFGATSVRATIIKSSYLQNEFVCEKLNYKSLLTKEIKDEIENSYILSQVPIDANIQDNKRWGADGVIVNSAPGYFALNFNVKEGDYVTFYGGNIGYSSAFAILLMLGNTVVSRIENTGLGEKGKYSITVPSGIDNIRASGVLGAKQPYSVFKKIRISDDCITGNGYKNGTQHTYIVGEGFMPTIQCACDFADSGDVILIKSGIYNEQVSIWNKKLHLIGEDVNTTFLVDYSGNYATPPLEMNIGSLSNITLIEYGTAESSDKYAYCLHVEAINPTEETFDVYNCRFINNVHAPVGIGLQKDYTIRFRNCVMECHAQNEGAAKERGALFCHLATTSNTPTNQHLIVEHCIISSEENIAILLGKPAAATGGGDYRFTGCTIWTKNNGISNNSVEIEQREGSYFNKVYSYGNTIEILNGNTEE